MALSLRSRWRYAPSRSAIGRARSVRGLPGGSLGRAGQQHRKLPVSAPHGGFCCSHTIKNSGPLGSAAGAALWKTWAEMEGRSEAWSVPGSHESDRGREGLQHSAAYCERNDAWGLPLHNQQSEREGSAAGIAAADFRCRYGAAGEVCVAHALLRVPLGAGMSVAMPVCWHWLCQGCWVQLMSVAVGSGDGPWAVESNRRRGGEVAYAAP